MPSTATYAFAYHQLLVAIAGSVCLFGTWVGMRHFARARATEGTTRIGWLFMASLGTGAALWASTFISILALDPSLNSGFEPVATGAVLVIAIVACLIGFEIGSRHFTLAPEVGGLVMGVGILAMHFIAFRGWHIAGHVEWNVYGVTLTLVLGLSLSALAVNRANRPVTRWCRHGAAIVLAFMICVMHYAMTASTSAVADASVVLPSYLIPAHVLGLAVVGAVLLVMGSGFSTYVIDLKLRTEFGRPDPSAFLQRHHDRACPTGSPSTNGWRSTPPKPMRKPTSSRPFRSTSTASRTSTTCSATLPATCC